MLFIYSEIEFEDLISLSRWRESPSHSRDLCDVGTTVVSSGEVNTTKPISLVGNTACMAVRATSKLKHTNREREREKALSLRYCHASTIGDSPTRDALVERLRVTAQSPTMSVNHEHPPQSTVSNRTDPYGIPISRRLSFLRRVPSRTTATTT